MNLSKAQPQTGIPAESLDDLYFEFQADLGMTKHIGATKATDELLRLCHVTEGSQILDVGCGVGLTDRYMAQTYHVDVVGVDIRPQMVARARQYAQDAGLGSQVRFEVADGQMLPFEDNRFDIVMCESVLAFIPDQPKALKEWMRVAKPGGYIGFTEAVWTTLPSEQARAQMDQYTGAGSGVQESAKWETLIEQSGLNDVICRTYAVNMLEETGGQIKRVGCASLLSMWGKTFKSLFTNPDYRRFLKNANQLPKSLMRHMGYGIYVGQVPTE